MKDLLTSFIVLVLNVVIFNDFATFGKVELSTYSVAGNEGFSIPCSFIFFRLSGLVQLGLTR